jgi:hypothetical protein
MSFGPETLLLLWAWAAQVTRMGEKVYRLRTAGHDKQVIIFKAGTRTRQRRDKHRTHMFCACSLTGAILKRRCEVCVECVRAHGAPVCCAVLSSYSHPPCGLCFRACLITLVRGCV